MRSLRIAALAATVALSLAPARTPRGDAPPADPRARGPLPAAGIAPEDAALRSALAVSFLSGLAHPRPHAPAPERPSLAHAGGVALPAAAAPRVVAEPQVGWLLLAGGVASAGTAWRRRRR